MRETDQRPPGGRRAARHGAASPVSGARRSPARLARRLAPLASSVAVLALGLTFALAPQPEAVTAPTAATDTLTGDTQTVSVASDVAAPAVSHESYATTTGPETLIASGTNEDWAKLVLIDGDFPVTEANITVMLRWMRQENGADNWWNRNNPLNNGYGSGGGSGLGSYDSLVSAADYCAGGLRKYSFYDGIEAALDAGDDADATARAIWASPWASSHYGNGTHWSTRPAEIVEAPADAWY